MTGIAKTIYTIRLSALAFCILQLCSCQTIDLYEKTVPIPKHRWNSAFKPVFKFEIKDTTVDYQLYITLRHNAQYDFNNIWLNLYVQLPDSSSKKLSEIEMPLASKKTGWLGVGMDDIYEQRIHLVLDPDKFSFSKAGTYSFTVEQIMRQDPLQHIMNIGLRLEKKTR